MNDIYGIETAILDYIVENDKEVKNSLSKEETDKLCLFLKEFLSGLSSAINERDVDMASFIFSDKVTGIPHFREKLNYFREKKLEWIRKRRELGLPDFADIDNNEKNEGIVTNISKLALELTERIKRAMNALGCK